MDTVPFRSEPRSSNHKTSSELFSFTDNQYWSESVLNRTVPGPAPRQLGSASLSVKRADKFFCYLLDPDDDVVDGDVDQLHEESDEAHDGEANSRCNSYLLKLFPRK